MTQFVVHERIDNAPSTHVLVVGVGKYPHLIGGEASCRQPDGMGQLSSPPLSARAVASWFINEYRDNSKPLASLAFLISEQEPSLFVNAATGESHQLEDATADNVEAAIRAWKERANRDPRNRLFFYFCGHGVAQGTDYALLAADVCADDNAPLRGALDLRRLIGGLQRCQASEQVFLVDACRASSDVLISDSDGYAGRVPLQPGLRPVELPRLLTAIYYSTHAGALTYAREGKVSLFTEALLKSLRGAASDSAEGPWRVTTAGLQAAIGHFLQEPVFAGEVAGVQVPVAGQLPTFNLHFLPGDPLVPVYVGCRPPRDNRSAEFVCLLNGLEKDRRPLVEVDPEAPEREWPVDLPRGRYDFRAEFAGGAPRSSSLEVLPPYRRVTLESAP